MNPMHKHTLLAAATAVALAACASYAPISDSERLALYQAHAGEPVRDIHYFNPMGWEEVDDEHIVVNMRPSESWLMRISGPCLRLGDGSPAITISNTVGRVSSGFDKISVSGSPAQCRIEEIRPIDMNAVSEARKASSAG